MNNSLGENDYKFLNKLDYKFLNKLVVRPGRPADDRITCLDMNWVISRTANEFEKYNRWATVDSLLAEAWTGKNPAAAKVRKKAAKEFAKGKPPANGADHPHDPEGLLVSLLHLPPSIGSVCGGDDDERVQLTALGFLLAGTASTKARILAKACHTCSQKKIREPGLKVEERLADLVAELAAERPKRQDADETELQKLDKDVRAVAPLVPGATMSGNPDSGELLVVHRAALAYCGIGSDPEKLKETLKAEVASQLQLKKKQPHQRLWKWTRLLLALISARQWVDETTIDPGPSWMPGNESPARKPWVGSQRNGQAAASTEQAHQAGAEDAPGAGNEDPAYLATLLNTYASQFGSYTTLLWQVPALSLTAQSFLMTIALGGGNSNVARLIASALSAVIAITSISLMHNQRGHAINHGELALRVSRRLRLAKDFGTLAINDAKPEFTDAESVWVGWDRHIYHVWKVCLGLFIVADVGIFLLVVARLVVHVIHPHDATGTWWL